MIVHTVQSIDPRANIMQNHQKRTPLIDKGPDITTLREDRKIREGT